MMSNSEWHPDWILGLAPVVAVIVMLLIALAVESWTARRRWK